MIKHLLLALFLFSCSNKKIASVDPVLQPYVDSYSSYSVFFLKFNVLLVQDISVVFVEDFDDVWQNGRCRYLIEWNGFISNREIQISKYWWNYMTETEKISLVFHEMGHCSLMRGHEDSYPSIMKSFTQDISENENYFIKELFQNSFLYNSNKPYVAFDRIALNFVKANGGPRVFEHKSFINKKCLSPIYKH